MHGHSKTNRRGGKIATRKIKISGHTLKNETVYLTVSDFKPYVYLQLPTERLEGGRTIKWTGSRRRMLFKFFQTTIEGKKGPLEYVAVKRDNLYYKDPILALRLTFRTQRDTFFFANKCHAPRGLYIEGLGKFPYRALKVHEHKSILF